MRIHSETLCSLISIDVSSFGFRWREDGSEKKEQLLDGSGMVFALVRRWRSGFARKVIVRECVRFPSDAAILEFCNWALVIDPPFRDLFLRFSHCVRMPIIEADRGWA